MLSRRFVSSWLLVILMSVPLISKANVDTYTMSAPVTGSGLYVPLTGGTVHSILQSNAQGLTGIPMGFDFAFDGLMTDSIGFGSDGTVWFDVAATGSALANDLDTGAGVDGRR